MVKYQFQCNEDKALIQNALTYNAWLMFGKNRKDEISRFWEIFNRRVKYISVLPYGSTTKYLKSNIPGICTLVGDGDKLAVEMCGYKNAPTSKYNFISHEGVHEIWHTFAWILPSIYGTETKTENGIRYCNEMGKIVGRDTTTGQVKEFYCKMFDETMAEIFTTIILASFDPIFKRNNNGITADTILKTSFRNWGDEKTGYSIFTSITRLAIAAFSNNGAINYQNLLDQGYGIIDLKTRTNSRGST